MTTSTLDLPINKWESVISDLLSNSPIQLNGSRNFDIQVLNPDFYKRVLVEGSIAVSSTHHESSGTF